MSAPEQQACACAPAPQPFVRSVLSGPGGQGSTGRVCAFLVVLFVCGWITFLVVHDKKIPELGPVTGFATTLIAALYGTNKVTALLAGKQGTCES